jgi:hypothetical protein
MRSNPFVLGYNDPVPLTNEWKPIDIFRSSTKVAVVLLNQRSAATSDSVSYRLAGQIGVGEES